MLTWYSEGKLVTFVAEFIQLQPSIKSSDESQVINDQGYC